MRYLILIPDFRNQYISNLILELKKTNVLIDYFNLFTLLNWDTNKKTLIISDKIKFISVLFIIFELFKLNKLNIWLILWNGERDKKTFIYKFFCKMKFAINLELYSPFYPSLKDINFIPIGKPRLDFINNVNYFNDKIIFIGELFENLHHPVINSEIDSQSWLFANNVFKGMDSIENINKFFNSGSYEEWVTINRIRYIFISQISKDFENFILVGDDFFKFNFPRVLPTNHSIIFRHDLFKNAFLNIDFLSKSTFSPVYPRSIECVSLNINFLQLQSSSFENVFGLSSLLMHTFSSYKDLKSKIENLSYNNYFKNSDLQVKMINILNEQKNKIFI